MEFLNGIKKALMAEGYLEVEAEQAVKMLIDLSNIVQYEADQRQKHFLAEQMEQQRNCGLM